MSEIPFTIQLPSSNNVGIKMFKQLYDIFLDHVTNPLFFRTGQNNGPVWRGNWMFLPDDPIKRVTSNLITCIDLGIISKKRCVVPEVC